MQSKRLAACTFAIAMLTTACITGQAGYTAPIAPSLKSAELLIEKPRADVWKALVPRLGESFFVINTLDQNSGLVNLSYSGDPEAFVDCGRITSSVQNLRGKRDYDFPASRASVRYESRDGSTIYVVDRTMTLDGRANLILEELTPSTTRVTVNVHYGIVRSTSVRDEILSVAPTVSTSSIAFNSREHGSFPTTGALGAVTCQSNGVFERRLLAMLAGHEP